MHSEPEPVDVDFVMRPNSLPVALGFPVFGVVLLCIFFTFRNPATRGWVTLFAVLFSTAFIVLGIWLLFAIMGRRRETPRSLSAQGVELRSGTVIPWANVSLIAQRPPTYPNGNLYEQTDIKFDNGKTASVSSDWIANFFDVNAFLVKKSLEVGIKGSEVSSPRSSSVHVAESTIGASATLDVTSSVLRQPLPPSDTAELGSIAVEFSMAQYVYVALFTPGLIIFGIYILSLLREPSTKLTGWTFYLILLVAIGLIIFGALFPFIMRRGRKRIARSFSEQGVEIWNGTVIPWKDVNVIAGGSEFIGTGKGGGVSYRKLDIRFRDGSGVYVSGYWASNFSELENYLAQMPQYSP